MPGSDQDIDKDYVLRSAEYLFSHFGKDAARHALKLADDFQQSGNLEGALLWRRIMKACQKLQQN